MPFLNMMHITLEIWGAVFSVVCVGVILLDGKKKERQGMILSWIFFLNMLLLVNDALAWIYRGDSSEIGWYIVRISNFMVFIMSPLIVAIKIKYIMEKLIFLGVELKSRWRDVVWGIVIVDILLITGSQFSDFLYYFDENNLYHRSKGYICSVVLADSLVLIFFIMILYYRSYVSKKIFFIFMLFILLPVLSTLVQLLNYGISLNNLTFTLCLIILFFNWEWEKNRRPMELEKQLLENELALVQQKADLAEKDAQLARKNAELTDMKTKIIMTQIQPHFLYNTLTAISYLCMTDPKKAKTAVDYFSSYLRMNLDHLQKEQLIPFEKELGHSKAFLWIEQLRFGDKLKVKYDIQWKTFHLPALTLQPLVENAVRHGICNTEDGGTVEIAVWKEEHEIYIEVRDDGTGFDPTKILNGGKTYIGIENVRERLQNICGGKLEIESSPGKGTTSRIILPTH